MKRRVPSIEGYGFGQRSQEEGQVVDWAAIFSRKRAGSLTA
jgi:hypothetical protein